MFWNCLLRHLVPFKRVKADGGYKGKSPAKVKCPAGGENPTSNKAMQSRVRSRHETLNRRLKVWEILKQTYRHEVVTHGDVFRAVAVIVQLAIDYDQRLFDV
jgi:hypothetical protein